MNEELHPEIVQVDALLRRASRALTYPPTPAIAAAVAGRLREAGQRPPSSRTQATVDVLRGWWSRRAARLALVGVIGLLAVLSLALAIPQSRSALADFFGLSHVRVEVGPIQGPTPPLLSPERFARPASVSQAQELVDFPLRFPTRKSLRLRPDAVYLQGEAANAPVVIFVYEDEGFDLYQTRGGFFGKGGPDPSLIHEIEFGGQPALWIDEGGHIASFLDEAGRVVVESRRTVDRATLLWEEGGITYRLETSRSQEEAIRVAESLR